MKTISKQTGLEGEEKYERCMDGHMFEEKGRVAGRNVSDCTNAWLGQ